MKNSDINNILDLLIDVNISKRSDKKAYYKLGATKEAGKQLLVYETLDLLNKICGVSGIRRVGFDFEHEYNDEGGTYLSISSSVYYESNGHSQYMTLYAGSMDDEFSEDFYKNLSNKEQEKLNALCEELANHLSELDEEIIDYASHIFNAQITQANVHTLYRDAFPEAMACIEKYFMAQSLKNKTKAKKTKTSPKM